MDFTDSTTWWVITVVLVAAELATGTFYLLMLALGTAAAALAAHAGLGVSGQYVTGAVIGAAAVGACYSRRRQRKQSDAATNPDVNLDVGSSVQVAAWRPDGTARVHYRGAEWDARYAGTAPAEPGAHVIRAVQGSLLLLERMHG
jgi:membrane protein implicated in regulation of membrane protease activity